MGAVDEFYAVAREALPSILFQDSMDQELIYAFATIFANTRSQVDAWLAETYILTATGFWLDQHAKDRGLRRGNGESDASLAQRIRTYAEAVNILSLYNYVNGILAANSLPTTGDIVELRQSKAYAHNTTAGHSSAFLSRGYRCGDLPPKNEIIIMTPYGTSADLLTAILLGIQALKAGGIIVKGERRLVP